NEWDEWGDPRRPDDFAVMRGYSPYENPPLGPRPDLLVTGALHDPRVLVHEPAKWVARPGGMPGWTTRRRSSPGCSTGSAPVPVVGPVRPVLTAVLTARVPGRLLG